LTVIWREPALRPAGVDLLSIAGLFAGIGGIELGLHNAGHRTDFLCEVDLAAKSVLTARFPGIPIHGDIRELTELPPVDLVAAGFPCQDLSQAGRTSGITGEQSGLIEKVFELWDRARRAGKEPRWLLLENVPFMLQLNRGSAMHYLTERLAGLGLRWAYRMVDTRSFGLPQRRHRVYLLASRTEDPRNVLFADDAGPQSPETSDRAACGFYWTEGTRGLGWAIDAVPTLKGGSTIGIPSPPAVWMPDDRFVTPSITDVERLQGFEENWTAPAELANGRRSYRWKLVGNAVGVPAAAWVGARLADPGSYLGNDLEITPTGAWPGAAWGQRQQVFIANVSMYPIKQKYRHLAEFLERPLTPLSERAAAGFLSRARSSSLRFPPGLLDSIETHIERMREERVLA
jgi:DNA (cytosine-5)-methyltransferase 1